jgi:hypothetical protein
LVESNINAKLDKIKTLLEIYKINSSKENFSIILKMGINKYMQGLVATLKILIRLDLDNDINNKSSKSILTKLSMINFYDSNLMENNINYFLGTCSHYLNIGSLDFSDKVNNYLSECQIFLYSILI